MAIWMIGDIQGCCDSMDELLDHPTIRQDLQAQFWFAGDLVNRGPLSLASLRRIKALNAICVLGNHDLHLLACAIGIRTQRPSDTIQEILDAPDAHELLTWLRHQPLAYYAHQHLMVHAGIHRSWDTKTTLSLAAEVQAELQSAHWQDFLADLFSNEPNQWDADLTGIARLRIITNILTRIRYCHADGSLDFKHSSSHAPDNLTPWFDLIKPSSDTIVFGHWSTIGGLQRDKLIALDTGCVWGGKLSAVRLTDKYTVQINCPEYQKAKIM